MPYRTQRSSPHQEDLLPMDGVLTVALKFKVTPEQRRGSEGLAAS